MNEDRQQQAFEMFSDAMERDAGAREAFIEDACGADHELHQEVQSLLAHACGIEIEAGGDGQNLLPLPSAASCNDRFVLGEEIARGAMGVIYWARDTTIQRLVAVKVLRIDNGEHPEAVTQFVAEAQISGHLQHPGVAPIYDFGRLPDGRLFFALKLIRGDTLLQLLRQRRDASENLLRFLSIFEQICQTIAYAHSHAVIHRDLKPDNVMVGEFGEVQVMDWGLAKALGSDAADQSCEDVKIDSSALDRALRDESLLPDTQTRLGVVMGTPAYMPPEQVAGRTGTTTDVFALGAVLAEILTGFPPYVGDTPKDIVMKSVGGKTEDCLALLEQSGSDPVLVEVARTCLDSDPKRRVLGASQIAKKIRAHIDALEQRASQAEASNRHAQALAVVHRKRRRVAAALGISIAAMLAAWVWIVKQAESHAQSLARLSHQKQSESEAQTYRTLMRVAFRELHAGHWKEAKSLSMQTAPELRSWEWTYLEQQLDQGLLTYQSPGRPVFALFTPAGQVLSVEDSGVVRRWQRDSGREISVNAGRGTPYAFGDSGQFILSGEPLRLWDASSGSVIREFSFELRRAWGRRSAIAANGLSVALSQRASRSIALIDTGSGQVKKRVKVGASFASFSFDGEWFFHAGEDKVSVRFWDVATLREARPPVECGRPISGSLALSRDRKWLAAGSEGKIFLHDLETDTSRQLVIPGDSLHPWPRLVFDNECRHLIYAGTDDSIRVWETKSGTLVRTIPMVFGNPSVLRQSSVNGPYLLLVSGQKEDRVVRLWNWQDDKSEVLQGHTGYVYPVAFSPDNSLIASGAWDHTVRLWHAKTGAEIAVLRGHTSPVLDLAFSPTNETVASLSLDREVCIWSLTTGAVLKRLVFDVPATGLSYHPDGSQLVLASQGVRVLGAGSLEQAGFVSIAGVDRVVHSPSGKTILLSSKKSTTLRVLDSASLRHVASWEGSDEITAVCYSPSGDRIAVGGKGGGIVELDAARMTVVGERMDGHNNEVLALAYLPDGTRLFSGGRDKTIRIWDTQSDTELGILRGHESYVYSLDISSDGQVLVSGSGDSTLRLWGTKARSERFAAIQESRILRAEVRPLVERLVFELGDFESVAEQLRRNHGLDPALSQEARHELLRLGSGEGR